jgi:hypothetical protein
MQFRWFVGHMGRLCVHQEPPPAVLDGDIACRSLAAVLADLRVKPLLSYQHCFYPSTQAHCGDCRCG